MKRKVFSAKISKQIFVIATFSMHSINFFPLHPFMLLFIEKLAKYTFTKEWKSARKWSVDGEVETNFYMERHAAWKKCGTRDYILNLFLSNSAFFENTNIKYEKEKKIWSIREKKAANCYTFIDFCLSRSPWHSQLILYLRSKLTSLYILFFPFLAFLSILSIIHTFLLYYSFFCCTYKYKF